VNNPKVLTLFAISVFVFGGYLTRLISIRSEFLLISISFMFTLLTFVVYYFLDNRRDVFERLKKINKKYFLFGPLGYFIYFFGIIQSQRSFGNMSQTVILNYTWPIFTVIFSGLLFSKKGRSPRIVSVLEGIGITFGFLAIVVLASEGHMSYLSLLNIKGLGWGLVAGLSYGLFSAFSGTVPKQEQSIFLLISISLSLMLSSIFSYGEIGLIANIRFQDIVIALLLGLVVNGLGYISWTRANRLAEEKNINLSSVASLMFATPVISIAIVSVLLGETFLLQPYFLLSLLLILVSSIICQNVDRLYGLISNRYKRA
jgi:drug/metabolite transporter (DMT)-like permease